MSQLLARGGNRLEGEVTIQSAKNSVLPVLAATILTGGTVELRRCPHLRDVEASIRILQALHDTRLCVCDIAETLNMTQSAISHQLRVLRSARLVKATREGRSVFYTLDDDHVARMFEQGLIHVTE